MNFISYICIYKCIHIHYSSKVWVGVCSFERSLLCSPKYILKKIILICWFDAQKNKQKKTENSGFIFLWKPWYIFPGFFQWSKLKRTTIYLKKEKKKITCNIINDLLSLLINLMYPCRKKNKKKNNLLTQTFLLYVMYKGLWWTCNPSRMFPFIPRCCSRHPHKHFREWMDGWMDILYQAEVYIWLLLNIPSGFINQWALEKVFHHYLLLNSSMSHCCVPAHHT